MFFFIDAQMKRKLIFDFWRSTSPRGRINEIINFVKMRFDDLSITEDQNKQLKAFLKKKCEKIRV